RRGSWQRVECLSGRNHSAPLSTSAAAGVLSYPLPMQPIQPDQAEFLRSLFLPTLHFEHKLTTTVISAIPLDQGSFRPDGISKGSLELAWHIAATEVRFLEAVVAGQFDLTPRPLPESIANSADLAKWYGEAFQAQADAVAKLSGEQ